MNFETLEADENLIMNKHFTYGRNGESIRYVVVHYNWGDLSIRDCYDVWQTRPASAHYQVDRNGRIGQLVWDRDTAWHAGNFNANTRSIGIEHANGSGGNREGDLTAAAIDAGAHLVAAVCKFYKLGVPEWKVNVFPHNHFSATACPGPLGRHQRDEYMRKAVSYYHQMVGTPEPEKPVVSTNRYEIRVVAKDGLNIRSGPSEDMKVVGLIPKSNIRYTIVETRGNWGRLKSGAGWIHLGWTERV